MQILLAGYSCILTFSLVFLAFFFYTIKTYKKKESIPIVYIYMMILCNTVMIFTEFVQDVFPVFLTRKEYQKFRNSIGKYITFIDNYCYGLPHFLTVLMVTERFYVIFYPFGQAFKNRNLWWYCLLFCIATLIFWLIPVFSECPMNFDYYTSDYILETECQHFLTLLFDDFHWTIPTTCMILNIGLILRLSYKRRKSTVGSASFRSHETLMMVQAVAFTIFLLSFEITKLVTFLVSEFLTPISNGAHRIIYYSQKTTVGLTCFLIYFVGTSGIRKIILGKFRAVVKFKKKKLKNVKINRIPIVYIYIMIICNAGVCFVEFYSDIFPYFISKKAYKWIYNNLGEYLTLFDYHVYTYPLLLTVLMIIERIYVIFSPFGRAFTDRKLWLYCFLLAIALLILLLIPFYSGCAVNYSFYTFDYSTECDPDGHFITYIFDTYTGLIPLGCLVLNFALIFYISQRRKRIDNTGNGKLNARQSHEKTLLIQSISSTTFLLIYEITEKATDIFSDEYEALPGFTRRMIYYARAGSVAFTCFFIYFVGTPSIRKIIMTKVLRIMRREKKQPSRMLTTWNSRDVSTMF